MACIYWKKSSQYLDMWCYISAQHQGVGVGGGCAPSHMEREAKGNLWLKMLKTSDLDTFYIHRGRSFYMYMYIMCTNGGYPRGGGGGRGMPPLPHP